jgi:hypothetical protein
LCLVKKNSLHDLIKNKYRLPYVIVIPFVQSKLPHGGKRQSSWLRVCATSQMVAGLIPDFPLINPSGLAMVLGSTRPLTEMSASVIYWGLKVADVQG